MVEPSSPVRRQSLADSGRRRLGGRSLEPSASEPAIIKPSWMQAAELRLAGGDPAPPPPPPPPLQASPGRRCDYESDGGETATLDERDIEAEFEAVTRLLEQETRRVDRRTDDGLTREVADAAAKRKQLQTSFLTDFDRPPSRELYPNYNHEVRRKEDESAPDSRGSVFSDKSSRAWAALVNPGARRSIREQNLARQEANLRRSRSLL